MGKKSKISKELEESVVEEQQTMDTNEDGEGLTYEEKVELSIPIAQPMAPRKLAKKVLKVAKKARSKKLVSNGLKIVKKEVLKGTKGFALLAGDADPMDVVSHLPIFFEENSVPYTWVPTRKDLGNAIHCGSALVLLVKPNEDYQEAFDEAYQKVKGLPLPV